MSADAPAEEAGPPASQTPAPHHAKRSTWRVLGQTGAALLLLVLAGASMSYLVRTGPRQATQEISQPALPVRVWRVLPQDIVDRIEAYGTASADRKSLVSAQVTGQIIEVSETLEIGSFVSADQVLLRIDPREHLAQLERLQSLRNIDESNLRQNEIEQADIVNLIAAARSEQEVAQRDYDRLKGLMEGGSSNARELDLARSLFEQSRRTLLQLEMQQRQLPARAAGLEAAIRQRDAEIAIAKLNLGRCTIMAPFAGQIVATHVELGAVVSSGSDLFEILDPRRIEVQLLIPASQSDRVRRGARCELRLPARPDRTWVGAIERIAPRADEGTRTLAVYVIVENRQGEEPLLAGVFLSALIEGQTIQNAIAVPRESIQRGAVFVIHDGRVRRNAVEVSRTVQQLAIVSGLKSGDLVATSHLDALVDGAAVAPAHVEPIAAEQPGPPAPAAAISQPTKAILGAQTGRATGTP